MRTIQSDSSRLSRTLIFQLQLAQAGGQTYAEALRVQGMQSVAQLGGRHDLALARALALPAELPLLDVKFAEQICQARHNIIALHAHAHVRCRTAVAAAGTSLCLPATAVFAVKPL